MKILSMNDIFLSYLFQILIKFYIERRFISSQIFRLTRVTHFPLKLPLSF